MVMEAKCVIAVSDLHFGMRNKEICMPEVFNDFLEWIKRLERGEVCTVKLGAWGRGREEKVLKPPDKLILMGDIIELWDATDRSIDICWRPILQSMADLKCEKVYLLGNHDIALMEIRGRYAIGASPSSYTVTNLTGCSARWGSLGWLSRYSATARRRSASILGFFRRYSSSRSSPR